MTDIIKGGVLLQETVKILNDICYQDGGIETDDDRIWSNWLHLLDNQDWQDMLASLQGLENDSPGVFYPADNKVFNQARRDLERSVTQGKNFVGKPKVKASGNKNSAWQTVMRIREVINRYRGDIVPNRPPSIYGVPKRKPGSATNFNNLFE